MLLVCFIRRIPGNYIEQIVVKDLTLLACILVHLLRICIETPTIQSFHDIYQFLRRSTGLVPRLRIHRFPSHPFIPSS